MYTYYFKLAQTSNIPKSPTQPSRETTLIQGTTISSADKLFKPPIVIFILSYFFLSIFKN